jgi:hypothetical protein
MNKVTMTEQWAHLWTECLFGNSDYAQYAVAQDAFDEVDDADEIYADDQEYLDIKALEVKFPLLKEIYSDFGSELSFGRSETKSEKWKSWFKKYKHLFFEDVEVHKIAPSIIKNGHQLLEVPICRDIDDTINNFRRYLESSHKEVKEYSSGPKYKLLTKNRKTVLSFEAVRRSVIAGTDDDLHNLNFSKKPHTVEDAIILFLQKNYEHLGLNWGNADRRLLMDKGEISFFKKDSIRTSVGQWRQNFKLLSANTIRGRFPDITPFDSRSWDLFQGKQSTPF